MFSSLINKLLSAINDASFFVVEVVAIVFASVIIFWFAQYYDAFEFLVEYSRAHEEYELDELFTLLMIAAFSLMLIAFRNARYLAKQVTKTKAAEESIKQLAFFDSLTGLANRELCTNRFEHILAHASRTEEMAAVLFIDLDNFKEVNDTYGHDAGDELLVKVSERLLEQLRKDDTLSRFAGDEFIILLESVGSLNKVTLLAEKILGCMQSPFRLGESEVQIGMSIGISTYPRDGTEANILFKQADTAMYYAKREGKNNFRFFSNELNSQARNKLIISTQLRRALERNEFELHYQPIIDVHSKNIKGAEALLRWNNCELGKVPPDVFIPIAEEIGAINDIGHWVLIQACRQNKKWHEQGHHNMIMSVNMSARQLVDDSFVSYVDNCLKNSGLTAKFLELELTETTIMKDVDIAIERVNELRNLGVSIALDDFGTGYSSIAYLRTLEISRIKIDRSFIENIPQSKEDIATTNAIISLASNLNLKLTAEGIETDEQREYIDNTIVDCAQGFLIGKPVPAKEFAQQFFSVSILSEPSSKVV